MRLARPCLLLMLVLLTSLTSFARAMTTMNAPLVYIALGDSVAYGVGASSPFTTYVNAVFEYLQGLNSGAVTSGVSFAKSEETSSSFINNGQLASALDQINKPDNDVSVVTLTIGGNDVLNLLKPGQPCANPQSLSCPPVIADALRTFTSNYTTILQQLTNALNNDPGSERLLVMTYYNPFSGVGGPAMEYEQATDATLLGIDGKVDCTLLSISDSRVGLNDLITCIGQFYDATIVDVYPLFKNRAAVLTHIGDPTPDIHPNDAGYSVIAESFIRRLLHRLYLPIVMRS